MAENKNKREKSEKERAVTGAQTVSEAANDVTDVAVDKAAPETAMQPAEPRVVAESPAAPPPAKASGKKALSKPKKKPFYKRVSLYVLAAVVVIVAILAVQAIRSVQLAMEAAASNVGNTVTVESRSLRSDILTTGTVKSKSVEKVYAPSSLKVKAILKDVGDTVRQGEELATLDTYQLEMDIKQTQLNIANLENNLSSEELSLSNSTRSASNTVETAKIQVEQAQRDYDKLLSQDGGSTVRNAEIALEDARRAYNDALNPASTLYNAQLDFDAARNRYDKAGRDRFDAMDAMRNAEDKMNSANASLKRAAPDDPNYANLQQAATSATTAYETAKRTYEAADAAMPDAQIAFEKARVAFDNSQKNVNDTMLARQDALEKAQMAYDDAVRNTSENLRLAEEKLKNAQISQKNASDSLKLARSKDAVSTQTNIELQYLNLESKEKQLAEAVLLAPSDGVVTYSNLSEGATANGLLYIVEDVKSLMIAATVGEYDIDNIKLGQRVVIKTDSTGNDEFIGEVTFISPTAQKGASGETTTTNSVKFDIEITVTQFDPRLLVGMNATASIITDEKDNALSVPFDAVYERDNGEKYVAVMDADGTVREVTVQTGIETDAFTEITAGDITEGMVVVLNYDSSGALTGLPAGGIRMGVGVGGGGM